MAHKFYGKKSNWPNGVRNSELQLRNVSSNT